jgi:hypothetical protein
MNDLLETKVTRTEFLDLILDDMALEISGQIDAIRKRIAAVPSVPRKLIVDLMPDDPEINYWDDGTGLSVRIEFKVKRADVPAEYRERKAALAALDKELQPVKERQWKLQNGKAKARIELIRRSLEATGEGRKLLEEAASLKLRLSRKLLMEPKP